MKICLNNLPSYLKFNFNKRLSRKTWNHFAWVFKAVFQSEMCHGKSITEGAMVQGKVNLPSSFFLFLFSGVCVCVKCLRKLLFSTLSFLSLVFLSSNAFMIYVMPRYLSQMELSVQCWDWDFRKMYDYFSLHILFKLKLNPVHLWVERFWLGFVFFLRYWPQCTHQVIKHLLKEPYEAISTEFQHH